MIGNKYSLEVYLGNEHIAKLSLRDAQLYWHYYPEWMQKGFAISPHLPLEEDIPSPNVQRYLQNLLPEGEVLNELVSIFHLSKNNTFALVRNLGADISGALIILPPEQPLPLKPTFRLLDNKELEDRLDKRDNFNLIIWDGKPRLSVAGIQEKINIVVDRQGQMGFGDGSLCSTHILKFEKTKLAHIAINEYMCMKLASLCGLNVAHVILKRFGAHAALLVERFDRKLEENLVVRRRHIIDACQALNIPPDYKYERNFGSGKDVAHIRDGVSLYKLFEFSNQCINPAKTKQQILDWLIFNILIFNFDAHGKNISFFVRPEGISLAPFYDLVNIKMYPEFANELAMALGDDFDGASVTAYQWADFADTCKIPRTLVTRQLNTLIKKLVNALEIVELPSINNDETDYVKKFKAMILERCNHLENQMQWINSVKL